MKDRSRPGEGGSEKTNGTVDDSISPTAPVITDGMSQMEAALTTAGAGMYVFPVDHPELPHCAGIGQGHNPKTCVERGKHPVVAFSTAADINPKMIHMWWTGPPRNVGINCGKSGLVVIDEDVLGAFKRYAEEHGHKIIPTMVVRTAKGRHYYYAAPTGIQLGNEAGALKDYSIDVRAGNAYVVGPGSVHASGVAYRIEVALPPAPLPDWVVQAIKAKTNSHKGDDGVWETVGGDFDRFELPEVIEDGQRDTVLFQYASSLLARELPRGEAEILIRAAWQRCEQPPIAKDLYPLESALAKLDRYEPGRSEGYEKGGHGQDDERATFDSLVAKEAAKIRVREAARALVDASNRPPAEPFDAGTLGEILARPPQPKARIEDLVPWEAGTLITAQRKVGKTTFIGNLCRSLINGGSFLGCFKVRPVDGNVAVLNFEMPGQTLAQWYGSMQIPHDRLYLVNLRARANPLATERERADLAAILQARNTETVVYDPFGRAYTGRSQNDPGEVGAWLAELDRFTRGEVGAKDLFLTAHAGWDGERTRGASALEDWADSIITLTRDKDEDGSSARYVRAIGRDVDLEEDQLRFSRDERYLQLARTGSRKATAEKRKVEVLRAAILEIVSKQPGINGTEVEHELREAGVTFQRGDHRSVLRALVEEKKLTSTPGKNNAKLYELAQIAQASPELAHGLAGEASPVRPYRDGLATTNTGTSEVQPEVGLAAAADRTNNDHTPPPDPVFADGAVQVNLFADVPEADRTQCRDCGTVLRPHLQARGTCGPCNAKETGRGTK
jgi:Bifunctional DNA primase/polymerase, N-terminal/AAA domain